MNKVPFTIYMIGLLIVILSHAYLLYTRAPLSRKGVFAHSLLNLMAAVMISYGYSELYVKKAGNCRQN